MDRNALNQALDALTIHDVYLREARVTMHPEFDPKVHVPPPQAQLRFGPKSSVLIRLKDERSGQEIKLFRVFIETAVRFLFPEGEPKKEGADETEPPVAAEITALFAAEYQVPNGKEPPKEALDEFAQHNVIYHVWPYWREFLQSACARASLPQVTLPMYRLIPTPAK